jgi:hypothetical protein
MFYTAEVDRERFVRLAEELAVRDRSLVARLGEVREAAVRLREVAADAVDAFRRAVHAEGAQHLADLEVGSVEPDEKHVDCVQVRIRRGRWEALVVAKAGGKVTLVGPFQRGKPETPCQDFELSGKPVEQGVEDLVDSLIRQASER